MLHFVIILFFSITLPICNAGCGCSLKNIKLRSSRVDDMILTNDQILLINGYKASWGKPWPNNELKYSFSDKYPENNKVEIRRLLKIYEEELGNCIKFTEDKSGVHAIVVRGKGCSASVGYNDKFKIIISLADSCVNKRNVKHEFTHVLGFKHEHSRPDRDEHLDIHLENIQDNTCQNFFICTNCAVTTPYDFDSIMQYHSQSFSCNEKPTMLKKYGTDRQIKINREVSPMDIKRVRDYYKC